MCGYAYIFYMNAAYNRITDSTHNDKDYRYRIGPCAWGMATFLSAFVRIVLQQRTSIMHSNCARATLEEWGPRGNLGILVGRWTGLDIANAKSTGAFLRMGPLGGQMLDPMRAADRDLVLAISANWAEVGLKNTFFILFLYFLIWSCIAILRIWSLLGEMLGLGPCRGCIGMVDELMNVISAWQRQMERIPSLQFWPGHDPWVLAWVLPCQTSFASTWRQQGQWLLSILAKPETDTALHLSLCFYGSSTLGFVLCQ